MKTKYIIIGLIILVVVLFIIQKKEHAGSTLPLSNDALINIGLIYENTGPNKTVSFNNIRATGNANVKNVIANGSGNFTGDVSIGGNTTFKRAGTGTGTTNFPASDNKNYIRGETYIDNNATIKGTVSFKGDTHFPYTDNKNYIRGETIINGEVKFNNDIMHKDNHLLKCNWEGNKTVTGDGGCNDDITINCKNGKIHKFSLRPINC